jgi:hypothetical protein
LLQDCNCCLATTLQLLPCYKMRQLASTLTPGMISRVVCSGWKIGNNDLLNFKTPCKCNNCEVAASVVKQGKGVNQCSSSHNCLMTNTRIYLAWGGRFKEYEGEDRWVHTRCVTYTHTNTQVTMAVVHSARIPWPQCSSVTHTYTHTYTHTQGTRVAAHPLEVSYALGYLPHPKVKHYTISGFDKTQCWT